MSAPTTSQGFDQAYAAAFTMWGDWRIPSEVKKIVAENEATRALELGCGVGRISRYMTRQGLQVTGVDFSPLAIEKAKARVSKDATKPELLVDDARDLALVNGPFDLSIDVGCFHCLDRDGQHRYVATLGRLLRPGATHLMWAMNSAPSDLPMDVESIRKTFSPYFQVAEFDNKRRRLAASWWYRLVRAEH